MARSCGIFLLFALTCESFTAKNSLSFTRGRIGLRSTLDEPPPSLTPNEKQAQLMKKMGYRWDTYRRCWVRGTAPSRIPIQARSGPRAVRFVGSTDDSGKKIRVASDSEVPPAVGAAVSRFEEAVRTARENGLQQEVSSQLRREFLSDGEVRGLASLKDAPLMWLICQVALFAILVQSCGAALQLVPGLALGSNSDNNAFTWSENLKLSDILFGNLGAMDSPILSVAPVLGIGFACGLALAALERKRWGLLPAFEGPREGQSKVIMNMADAGCGVRELGKPWQWRVTFPDWKRIVVGAELVAATNAAVMVHAGFQAHVEDHPPFVSQLFGGGPSGDFFLQASGDPSAAAVYSALCGVVAVAAWGGLDSYLAWSNDGVNEEVAAARRASRTAAAHFYVTPAPLPKAASGEEPTREEKAHANDQAVAATKLMADAWAERFGPAASEARRAEVALWAALIAGTYAAAFTLSGGSLLGPLIARGVHLADRYFLEPDEERCRVNIELASVDAEVVAREDELAAQKSL